MAIVRIDDKHYKAIADALREHAEISEKIFPEDMPAVIPFVKNVGWNIGYEAGKQAQYDEFWDTLQNNGNGANYYYAFAYGKFTDKNYNPKYDIKATMTNSGSSAIFYSSPISDTKVTIIAGNSLQSAFYSCESLKTIQKLIVTKACKYVSTFGGCSNLEYIRFEGEIGEDIAFGGCPLLTYESLIGDVATEEQIAVGENLVQLNGAYYYGGILGALYDYSGTTTTHTLTLGTTNLAKLTDAEKAIATQRGWTLA